MILNQFSRYSLICLTIFVLAFALPVLFATLFEKRTYLPMVTYSLIHDEFFIHRYEDNKRMLPTDSKGRTYTDQSYIEATPLASAFALNAQGLLPDSIKGVKLDMHSYMHDFVSFGLIPIQFSQNIPESRYRLFPLFESTGIITLPGDLCRLQQCVEFINTHTNRVNQEKSQRFTEAFINDGFDFPADLIVGNPRPKKRRDDGWFLTDSSGAFFHFKMINGQPYIKRINTPEHLSIIHFNNLDTNNGEIFGYIVGQDHRVYVLLSEDYRVSQLPIYDYDPEESYIRIFGNILYHSYSLYTDHSVTVYILNRDYELLNTYYEEWIPDAFSDASGLFGRIVPFQIKLLEKRSDFRRIEMVRMSIDGYQGVSWLYLNIVMCVVFLLAPNKRRFGVCSAIDLVFILLTGLYGFIATTIFQQKEL